MYSIPIINKLLTDPLLLALLEDNKDLESFHNGMNWKNIDEEFLEKRELSIENRKLLVDSLLAQYEKSNITPPKQIHRLLNKGVFTVTTGHQLCLFGGPQFFIHKIVSILKLVQDLKSKFSKYDFVPLFWMASEDHDFEEISGVEVFGNNIKISGKHDKAVGRINSIIFHSALLDLENLLSKDQRSSSILNLFKRSFNEQTWASATRYWIHELFKDYGLVILDADQVELKESFIPIMEKEIKEEFVSKNVSSTNDLLANLNYKARISPRRINLFYLSEMKRSRIILNDSGSFKIGERLIEKEELIAELLNNPECFSPNVLLRPIYQEFILPNVIYVGGPSEISYWAQLKNAFDCVDVLFPVLQLRDHFSWIDSKSIQWWLKQGYELSDLINPIDQIIRKGFVENNEFELNNEKEQFHALKNSFLKKVIDLNPSMEKTALASFKRMENEIQKLENRLLKEFKLKNEQQISKAYRIQRKLLVKGTLNERVESFIGPYLNCQKDLLDELFANSNVLDPNLKILLLDA